MSERKREGGEGAIDCPILKFYIKLCMTKLCFSYMKYCYCKKKKTVMIAESSFIWKLLHNTLLKRSYLQFQNQKLVETVVIEPLSLPALGTIFSVLCLTTLNCSLLQKIFLLLSLCMGYYMPDIVNRTFGSRSQSNTIEINPWIESDRVRQSNQPNSIRVTLCVLVIYQYVLLYTVQLYLIFLIVHHRVFVFKAVHILVTFSHLSSSILQQ